MSTQFDPYAAPAAPGAPVYAGATSSLVQASFASRFGALFIDAIIISAAAGIIGAVLRMGADTYGAQGISILIGLAYYAGFWSMNQGQTLGKQLLKIKVVDENGNPPTLAKSAIRFIGYYVNSIPLMIGWLWALKSEGKTFADMLAGTRVVKAG